MAFYSLICNVLFKNLTVHVLLKACRFSYYSNMLHCNWCTGCVQRWSCSGRLERRCTGGCQVPWRPYEPHQAWHDHNVWRHSGSVFHMQYLFCDVSHTKFHHLLHCLVESDLVGQ